MPTLPPATTHSGTDSGTVRRIEQVGGHGQPLNVHGAAICPNSPPVAHPPPPTSFPNRCQAANSPPRLPTLPWNGAPCRCRSHCRAHRCLTAVAHYGGQTDILTGATVYRPVGYPMDLLLGTGPQDANTLDGWTMVGRTRYFISLAFFWPFYSYETIALSRYAFMAGVMAAETEIQTCLPRRICIVHILFVLLYEEGTHR